MGIRLDGKVAAINIKEALKKEFSLLNNKACLAIIHFDDMASNSYLKGRMKIADELGVSIKAYKIDESYTTNDILKLVNELNNDSTVNGIMIDRPLPKKYDEFLILSSISSNKDVDGYTPFNLGKLLSNKDCFYSATPYAAIRLLEYYNVDLEGKNVLVIGRSVNVGKPLANLLLNKNATVTIAHSKTKDLKSMIKNYDFVFLALGKANFVNVEDINENIGVIDIGINFDEFNKICGDANKEIYDVVKYYSPVPGGVGVMTNVVLMENLLKACKNQLS